ncbi:MAG: riboflavin biosynthesis protein RibF [Clostridia bacterium]|nr:riboflavin biosynthesis protein RibF [Clostridia bacterium]
MPHVIVLGTFDGLHKGHQAVLNAALNFKDLIPVAVTFPEPPKRRTQSTFVPMLLSAAEKNEMLECMGFSEIFVLDYDEVHDFEPTDFLDMLFERYEVKAVVCGFNYRFGKGGQGDAALLSHYCSEHGAEAVVVPATTVSGQTVSSSLIRELISNGDIAFANTLLGRPFSFKAEVIHGEERGRKMGFPTINQQLDDQLATPRFGVYATAVTIDDKDYPGVTNIGIRPTFLLQKPLCETYIIGFEGDLYGRSVALKLLSFMREEQRFDSLEELAYAIESDKEKAIKAFQSGILPCDFE